MVLYHVSYDAGRVEVARPSLEPEALFDVDDDGVDVLLVPHTAVEQVAEAQWQYVEQCVLATETHRERRQTTTSATRIFADHSWMR